MPSGSGISASTPRKVVVRIRQASTADSTLLNYALHESADANGDRQRLWLSHGSEGRERGGGGGRGVCIVLAWDRQLTLTVIGHRVTSPVVVYYIDQMGFANLRIVQTDRHFLLSNGAFEIGTESIWQ